MAIQKCSDCSRPASRGKARCEVHLKIRRNRHRKRYVQHRRAGLCAVCDEPALRVNGVTQSACETHRKAARRSAKVVRAQRRHSGTCMRCHLPAVSGGVCRLHWKQQRQSSNRRVAALIAARRASGECVECGEPAAMVKGARQAYCSVHREQNRVRAAQRRADVAVPKKNQRWVRWSSKEDDLLAAMRSALSTDQDIATALNRTVSAVKSRIHALVGSGQLPQSTEIHPIEGGPGPRAAPSAPTPGFTGRTRAATGEARRTRTRG
jgi:hypothetical protein